jgi:peptide/nickel transport system permease protein
MASGKLLKFMGSFAFVVTVSFLALRMIPGDPGSVSGPEDNSTSLPTEVTREYIGQFRRNYGAALPPFYFQLKDGIRFSTNNQFHQWLFGDEQECEGILKGDLGRSLRSGQPVTDMIREQLPYTLGLSVTALILAFLISVPAGLYIAHHRGGIVDKVLSRLSLIIFSLPIFWTAALLQLSLADPEFLGWFHASGIGPSRIENPSFLQQLPYLLLPLLCYLLYATGFLIRTVRDAAIREYATDHIRTARAVGLQERRIRNTHLLRNLTPERVTVFGNSLPFILSGSVLIESVFALPGMGRMIENAIHFRDYPVLSGVFLVTALFTLAIQACTDFAVRKADPRTRQHNYH